MAKNINSKYTAGIGLIFIGMIMFIIALNMLPTVASDQATAEADANISGTLVEPFVQFSALLFFLPAVGCSIGGFIVLIKN